MVSRLPGKNRWMILVSNTPAAPKTTEKNCGGWGLVLQIEQLVHLQNCPQRNSAQRWRIAQQSENLGLNPSPTFTTARGKSLPAFTAEEKQLQPPMQAVHGRTYYKSLKVRPDSDGGHQAAVQIDWPFDCCGWKTPGITFTHKHGLRQQAPRCITSSAQQIRARNLWTLQPLGTSPAKHSFQNVCKQGWQLHQKTFHKRWLAWFLSFCSNQICIMFLFPKALCADKQHKWRHLRKMHFKRTQVVFILIPTSIHAPNLSWPQHRKTNKKNHQPIPFMPPFTVWIHRLKKSQKK